MPKERQKSLERALEEAVSRALRDNLAPLQRTADELHQAYADLVAACSSSRPSNALPAMLRAQTAASALAAGLSVLSNFVAVALNPRDSHGADERASARASAVAEVEEEEEEAPAPAEVEAEPETESEWAEGPSEAAIEAAVLDRVPLDEPVMPAAAVAQEVAVAEAPAFDLASLPPEMQDLHRRANRVA